ncbi:MAG: Hsp70 family protein [Myxococcota bacterium]
MSGASVLGIDLGTTNSVVAVSDGGEARVLSNELGQRLVPSVVSFKPGGGVLVGETARERRLLDAKSTIYSVKRLIGRPYRSPEVRTAQERFAFEIRESPTGGVVVGVRGETYTLTEISAFVLREVARVAELSLGSTSRAVVTVPANFNELQRSATKAAGRVAGLEVLRIINEPTAAALAYGYGKQKPERVAVFDLGGGTFDITILDLENDVFEVIATAGDSFLGGDDVDLLIAEMMCDAFLKQHRWDPRTDRQAYERLRAAAEWAKCQLSLDHAVELTVEELHYGNGGKRLDLEFSLERAALENAVRPLLARSFDVCQDAFREAGMKPTAVDSVVLVGGSTRMPLVRSMVKEYFKMDPRDEIDPDLVVAQGAAIHGFAVGGRKRKRARSLGRVALKKVSSKDLARMQAERKERQASLPKQPAFAPTAQVDAPTEPKVALTRGRSGPKAPPQVPPPQVPPPRGRKKAPPPPVRRKRAGTQLGMGAARPPAPPPTPADEVTVTTSSAQLLGRLGDAAKPQPPPAPSLAADVRGFDEDEETARLSASDDALAALRGIADEPASRGLDMSALEPDRPTLDVSQTVVSPGLDMSAMGGAEPSVEIDLDDPADELRAALADLEASNDPAPGPSVPTFDAPSIHDATTSAGFDLPTFDDDDDPTTTERLPTLDGPPGALPGVIAAPVVSIGRTDNSQVDAQLADFLKSEDSVAQPAPLAPPPPSSQKQTMMLGGAPPPPPAGPPAVEAPPLPDAPPPMPPPPQTFADATDTAPLDPFEGTSPSQFPSMPPPASMALVDRAPPLLMDVTPHSLGIETAGGFCQHLLRRNAPIPAEQSRVFSTAQDLQDMVSIRVCQGEEKRFDGNQLLGAVELTGLRRALRGEVQIDVAFQLDADGTLDVRAVDRDTGKEQTIRINLLGGASDDDIEQMRARQQALIG